MKRNDPFRTLVRSGDLDTEEAEALLVAASHAAHGDPADAVWQTRHDVARDYRDAKLAAFAAGAAFAWALPRPEVEPASYRAPQRARR